MQNNETVNVLDELVKLAKIQRARVFVMLIQEEKSGFFNPRLETAIRVFEHLLLSIQKIRFDLGLDEYKRCSPRAQTVDHAEAQAKQQRVIFEAYKTAKELIRKRLGPDGVMRLEKYPVDDSRPA